MQADENGVEGAKVGSGDQQEEQGQVEETVTRAVAAHLVLQEVAAHLVLHAGGHNGKVTQKQDSKDANEFPHGSQL